MLTLRSLSLNRSVDRGVFFVGDEQPKSGLW
jgi:hypothetical protein